MCIVAWIRHPSRTIGCNTTLIVQRSAVAISSRGNVNVQQSRSHMVEGNASSGCDLWLAQLALPVLPVIRSDRIISGRQEIERLLCRLLVVLIFRIDVSQQVKRMARVDVVWRLDVGELRREALHGRLWQLSNAQDTGQVIPRALVLWCFADGILGVPGHLSVWIAGVVAYTTYSISRWITSWLGALPSRPPNTR